MVLSQMTFDLMQALEILGPLALIIGGITVYGVFVFNFYRFLARKDIFTLDLQKHNQARRPALRKTISVIFYIFKCLMLYPVFVFFWFFVMGVLLYLLSRNQSMEVVMLVAMGVVGAIRVCSYYKEALATDISKVLPFALLGIMLIDNSLIRVVESTENVAAVAFQWETLVSLTYYLAFVVSLEFLLRMTWGIFGFFRDRRMSRNERREQQPKAEEKQTGTQLGGAGTRTVFEPRPVGLGSAPPLRSSGAQGMSARPAFIHGRDDERRSRGVESPDLGADPQVEDFSEQTEWVRRSRPVYASSTTASDMTRPRFASDRPDFLRTLQMNRTGNP